MSPRHFAKAIKSNNINRDIDPKILYAPNFWYAFTAATGIDKVFSHTALENYNNPVKDSQSGTQDQTSNTKSL